jgi:hypothetical protein
MAMDAQTLAKWRMALRAKVETTNLQMIASKYAEMGLTSGSMSVMMATPTVKMDAQAAAR